MTGVAANIVSDVELTILMPCLNEAETLGPCIAQAREFLHSRNIDGEVLIADNGSEDGSQDIARRAGGRVIDVRQRGYGAALRAGIAAARGRFVIMGDADASYDFSRLDAFVERLRAGDDLVMGNRFRGGIAPGAMPFLHRFLGNPVLSWLGRLIYGVPVHDFHCGLRGFGRERMLALELVSPGMEFASEMIVKAQLQGLRISEVPTTLSPDGRSRPSHLRTWRDGWRHLRFLLLLSPRWLFLYPGLLLFFLGAALAVRLYFSPLQIAESVWLDVNGFVLSCMMVLIGSQLLAFAALTRSYAARSGMLPSSPRLNRILRTVTLERTLLIALLIMLAGTAGLGYCVAQWAAADFGDLRYASLVKPLTLSGTVLTIGAQLLFSALLSEMMGWISVRSSHERR